MRWCARCGRSNATPRQPLCASTWPTKTAWTAPALHAAKTAPEVLALYRRFSDEAVAQGIFGAPNFLLDGERFREQDRLDFLDRALDARRMREGL